MGIIRFRAEDLIDPDTEAQYVFIHSVKATSCIHRHEFFEVFLVIRGNVDHIANNIVQHLAEGHLVFIRPDDAHYYAQNTGKDGQIINLGFSLGAAQAMFEYLGRGLHSERLLRGDAPPCVLLSKAECNIVMTMLEELEAAHRTKNGETSRMMLRALLVEIFSKYFLPDSHSRKMAKPEWLTLLCREMQSKENLYEGIPAMVRLSGMSHEYLCRQFKTHLNLSPGDFINSLRMNYASNLLVQSKDEILSIAMEVGFNSLSHFYHVFRKYYGETPSVYRKMGNKKMLSI